MPSRDRSERTRRTKPRPCRPCPTGAPPEPEHGDGERDGAVQRDAAIERRDPVFVDAREDLDQRGGPPEGVPESRRRVVVERGQAARREAREEVRDPGRHEPAQRIGAHILCGRRARSGEEIRDGSRRDLAHHEERQRGNGERDPEPGYLTTQAPFLPGDRQGREDREADRLRREHDHDEDAVGGEETVRLLRAPELVRDDDADDRREARHDEHRHGGERRARQ